MRLCDVQDFVAYYEERQRVRGRRPKSGTIWPDRTFSIEQPHKCQSCAKVSINGASCKAVWEDGADELGSGDPHCVGALRVTQIDPTSIRLHETFGDIVDASRGGCALFKYLGDLLVPTEAQSGPFEGSDSHDIIFCLVPKGRHRLMIVSYLLDEIGNVASCLHHPVSELTLWTTQSNPASAYLPIRPHETDRTSTKSIRFAQESFGTCLEKHRSCRQPVVQDHEELAREVIREHDLPARLLEIYRKEGILLVRLVETSKLPPALRSKVCDEGYATLSYCWGGDQAIKLTATSETKLKLGLHASALPSTIHDAIYVADAVGLCHIWIDAMCIFQDSDSDKEAEIARMPLYYGCNTVTISAASSTKSDEGIRGKIAAGIDFKAGPFELEFSTDQGVGSIQLFSTRGRPAEPIDKRAWTFQESALSRRALVFATDQLRWHCIAGEASCGGPDSWREESANPVADLETCYSMSTLHVGRVELRTWNTLVHHYMQRQLSVPADKLMAISALADRTYNCMRGSLDKLTYVAGLFVIPDRIWSWIDQLIWVSDARAAHRPVVYRAPSWSWASLDTNKPLSDLRFLVPPGYNRNKFDVAFSVGDFTTDLSLPTAKFGAVTGARLEVTGYLGHVRGRPAIATTFPESHAPLALLLVKQPTRTELFLLPDTNDDRSWIECALEGNGDMYMMELIPPLFVPGSCRPAVGLLLKSTGAQGRSKFQRIGAFVLGGTYDEESVGDIEALFDPTPQSCVIV